MTEENIQIPHSVIRSAPTERDFRQLNREFIKSIQGFNDSQHLQNVTEFNKLFGEVEKICVVLRETAESFKRFLSPEDSQKVAETNEKIDLVIQQFEISKSSLASLEKISKQQRMKLAHDLQSTSHKNTVSARSHHTGSSRRSNRLFDYDDLSPQEKVLVAETKLQAAALEVELARKLAAARNQSSHDQSENGRDDEHEVIVNPQAVQGGSKKTNVEKVQKPDEVEAEITCNTIIISGRWCQRGTTTFKPLWHIV